jgi:hypothetical protein
VTAQRHMESLSAEQSASVTHLALALWLWDAAGLEPGDTAIYTSGAPHDRWIALVAGWRSAREVVRLNVGRDLTPTVGVIERTITDPQEAVGWLSGTTRAAPGVVAAILTAESAATDVLLAALPMWTRIVLATPTSSPTTVDFYDNVHRKGTRIVSVPSSAAELEQPHWRPRAAAYVTRAARILGCERLASQCPL